MDAANTPLNLTSVYVCTNYSDSKQTFLRYFDTHDWRYQYSAFLPELANLVSLSASQVISFLADLLVVCAWAVLELVEAMGEKDGVFWEVAPPDTLSLASAFQT